MAANKSPNIFNQTATKSWKDEKETRKNVFSANNENSETATMYKTATAIN